MILIVCYILGKKKLMFKFDQVFYHMINCSLFGTKTYKKQLGNYIASQLFYS